MNSGSKTESLKKLYGLIGRDISYSFSRRYFTEKFENLGLSDFEYVNFDLEKIDQFESVVRPKLSEIGGLNVTIPYKEEILQFLDEIDPEARQIGAVNTIKILPGNKLKGFNTDVYGFEKALSHKLDSSYSSALILGTGGASKAVAYVMSKLGLSYKYVSRSLSGGDSLLYGELDREILEEHKVIVNCTPLGTFPDVEKKPDVPYQFLTSEHLLFDLIYNPEKTAFLLEGEAKGAKILNGSLMLKLQADRAWAIWNS